MIIDAHSHILNSRFFDKIAAVSPWAKEKVELNALPYARIKPRFSEVTARLETLDRHGYDMQVVIPQRLFDSSLCPGGIDAQLTFVRVLNDSMADLTEQSKGRLIPVGNVPMNVFEPGGRREMERVSSLGLKAVFVSTNIFGKPLDAPEFEPFWAAAAEIGIAVYIHPIEPVTTAGRPYEAEYDLIHNVGWPYETELALLRLVYSGIIERYPSLTVISHQLGGGLPFFFARTVETYDQAVKGGKPMGKPLSKPLAHYFSRFYYDTAVGEGAPAIECTLKTFGADRIVFATDDPSGPGNAETRFDTYPTVIKSLGLSKPEENKVFSNNIRQALGLK